MKKPLPEAELSQVLRLLAEFDEIDGISGREREVSARLERYMAPLCDEIRHDRLGNVYFIKKGKNPDAKLMITAHMDEIGFIINDIYPDGRLSMMPVGIHNPRMLCSQVLSIYTTQGIVEGVVCGAPPPHLHESDQKEYGFPDLKIDVGTDTPEETLALGIKIGDYANNRRGNRVLNGRVFSGKAVDNRSGCVAMLLAARMMQDVVPEVTVCFAGTVQEEVFLRGARVASRTFMPDVSLTVDVCLGSDSNEIAFNSTRNALGMGPCIQIYDWNPATGAGNLVPPELVDMLHAAAEQADAPWQNGLMLIGGTEAAELNCQGNGVISGGVHIPARYIHSSIGTVDAGDVYYAAKILAQFAQTLEPSFALGDCEYKQ